MAIGTLKAGVNSQDVTASTGTDVVDTVNYLYEYVEALPEAADVAGAVSKSSVFEKASSELDVNSLVIGKSVLVDNDIYFSASSDIPDNTTLDAKWFGFLPDVDALTILNITGDGPQTFTPITVNMDEGSTEFQSTTSYSIGDYVFIRSQTLMPDPNTQGVKFGQIFKIENKVGNIYTVDVPSEYTFTVADTAECAVCLMKENITIKNLVINSENYANLVFFGIRCYYVNNLTIENLKIIGTKDRYSADIESASAIKIGHCLNVRINNVITNHIGWYGIEVLGACRNVDITNTSGTDCRHAISINWSEAYGEPVAVKHTKCFAYDCTSAGLDTHDVGKRITYYDCESYGSKTDSGFQQRCNEVEYHDCIAKYNELDGFVQRLITVKSRLFNCTSDWNTRHGYGFSLTGADVIDCNGSFNVSDAISIRGGSIIRGKWIDNVRAIKAGGDNATNPQFPLLIDGIYAPKSATQLRLIYLSGGTGVKPEMITMKNSYIVGYAKEIFIKAGYATNPRDAITYDNQLFDDNGTTTTLSGIATLTAGAATVNSLAIIKGIITSSADSKMSVYPKIKITPLTQDVNSNRGFAFVDSIDRADTANAFTIKSTNAADTSSFIWSVSY